METDDHQMFIDPSDFSEPESALDLYSNSIRSSLAFKGTLSGPTYVAKVLSPPLPLNPAQAGVFNEPAAVLGSGPNAPKRGRAPDYRPEDSDMDPALSKFTFYGRIEKIHGGLLREPCPITYATEPAAAYQLIRQHIQFISAEDTTEFPTVGDLVNVRLRPGSAGKWDLQYGKYLNIHNRSGVTPPHLTPSAKNKFDINTSPITTLGGLGTRWVMTAAGYPRCAARKDNVCGPKDDPSFSKCKNSVYPSLKHQSTDFYSYSASEVMTAIKDSGQSTSVQKIMWAIISHEQPKFRFPANNPSGIQLDNSTIFRGARESDFDYQTCFRDNGGDQRIFAGFNTLTNGMKAFGKIIAAKAKNPFKSLKGESTSADAETMTWNYYRSWNTKFTPAELEALKATGKVIRGNETISRPWQQTKIKFQSALALWS
jgi:hypothetical protein